jgi:hypothetical protein
MCQSPGVKARRTGLVEPAPTSELIVGIGLEPSAHGAPLGLLRKFIVRFLVKADSDPEQE